MSNTRQIFAKQLRSNMTDAEKLLWHYFRGHWFNGAKFKRQQPLGNYIVDFICFEAKLVIEVDGGQHLESGSDKRRDEWLQEQGFRILRFWNNEVLVETESVLEKILHVITPSDGTTSHLTNPAKNAGQVIGYSQPSPTRGEGASRSSLVGEGFEREDKSLERVHWRARRGLLELDIVLGRFIEAKYAGLSEAEKLVFEEMLDMPDNPLWDMIAGREEAADPGQQALLEKIRAA